MKNDIVEALHRHAGQRPRDIAIHDGETCLSWRELAQQVETLCDWLNAENARTVAFQLDNGIDWVVVDLALLSAGLTSVPIPTFFSATQTAHALQNSSADLLLTANGSLGEPLTAPRDGLGACRLRAAGTARSAPGDAKITYTSGSTGNPRGVRLANTTIETVARGIVDSMASLDIERHACLLPLSTLLENIAGLYAPILKGIEIHVPPPSASGVAVDCLDTGKFAATLDAIRPDSIILVPQLLMALVTLKQLGLVGHDRFKMIAVGGGHLSNHLLKLSDELGLPVFQGYGLSECASVVTLNLPGANRRGSVGRPLPHVEIRTTSDGELQVAGAMMSGYVGQPSTRSTPAEWLSTGDLGHIDEDGYVYIDGRKKNLFITAFGRNVSPEWTEASLTQYPAVAHALVFGEGRDHNLALLWLRFPQTHEQLSELVTAANAELPGYARTHAFEIVEGEMPCELVTANGRLKRQSVIDRFRDLIEQHYDTRGIEHAIL